MFRKLYKKIKSAHTLFVFLFVACNSTKDIDYANDIDPISSSGKRLTNVPRNGEHIIECGDHMLHGSVEGAILSGRNSALIAINRLTNNTETVQGPRNKV